MCLCVLEDGRIASGSRDGSVRVWRLASDPGAHELRPEKTFWGQGAAKEVRSVCALGNIIVAGGPDRLLRFWDLSSANGGERSVDAKGEVTSLVALGGGKFLCGQESVYVVEDSRYGERNLSIWDYAEGQMPLAPSHCVDMEWNRSVRGAGVTCVGALGDGRIISVSGGPTLSVWRPQRLPRLWTQEGHAEPVSDIIQIGDGSIVTASEDATLRLWSSSGLLKATLLVNTDVRKGAVLCACALPDGRFVSCQGDCTVHIWGSPSASSTGGIAVKRQNPILAFSSASLDSWVGRYKDHTTMHSASSVFAVDDSHIATFSLDGVVRIWNSCPDQKVTEPEQSLQVPPEDAADLQRRLSCDRDAFPRGPTPSSFYFALEDTSPVHLHARVVCSAVFTSESGSTIAVVATETMAVHFLELIEPGAVRDEMPEFNPPDLTALMLQVQKAEPAAHRAPQVPGIGSRAFASARAALPLGEPQEPPLHEKTLKCRVCHLDFPFSVHSQRRFKELDYPAPVRCPACREKRKQQPDGSGRGAFRGGGGSGGGRGRW